MLSHNNILDDLPAGGAAGNDFTAAASAASAANSYASGARLYAAATAAAASTGNSREPPYHCIIRCDSILLQHDAKGLLFCQWGKSNNRTETNVTYL